MIMVRMVAADLSPSRCADQFDLLPVAEKLLMHPDQLCIPVLLLPDRPGISPVKR